MSSDASKWKHYPKEPVAPDGAPNVLLIMTDDVGFGAASTFGGPAATPAFDALAEAGLRYNAFHTTAMCSPTRASLLTGRNHHAVASGSIADVSVDEEGYTSVIPKSAATIGRVLKENGYDTAFIGKNHNTPTWENGPLGPFDHWPNAWGFDYFYGFNGPFADQFYPDLLENRNPVRPPEQDDYILDRDLADHLINWLQMQHTLRPGHPFFAYFSSGSTHAPHQAPEEWIARYKGQFDQGWDKLREETFERQKKQGVVPADALLTPRPRDLPAWDSLDARVQQIYARKMEVAAAMLAYVDHQVGRVIEQLRATGQLDNTMVIYIQGDNGASIENLTGSMPAQRVAQMNDAELADEIAAQGGPDVFGDYPAAWAWATNAPFQWGKQIASHLGGLRDGLVISWPKGIRRKGEVRGQFGHVIDIAPTIYEAAGIMPPSAVDGVAQQPIDGISMVYTFDDPDAPERHRQQYFEMLGNRGYYKDGWIASTTPGRAPWEMQKTADPYAFGWELYNMNTDWSQSKDVAAEFPDKLAELQADFDKAAERYHVYPLNNDLVPRMAAHFRPNRLDGRTRFTYYPGDTAYPGMSFPNMGPGWSVVADVRVDGARAEGPILVQGGHFGSQSLVLSEGKPAYILKPGGERGEWVVLRSPAPLTAGDHQITVQLTSTGEGPGMAIALLVDGKPVANGSVPFFRVGRGNTFVGRCGASPLTLDGAPIAEVCSSAIRSVTIEKASGA